MKEENQRRQVLVFPCPFTIKVVGIKRESLFDEINSCVLELCPEYSPEKTARRLSARGRYESFSVVVQAQSREHLDHLYAKLVKIEGVKFVL
ncbi:DUF493 domain-containing protein [Mesosutterella sp. AGMB02718]|uniref:UPF0250 protein MUN46_002560 n=1 Tax=Mesosutterella faecium TaxID=2925194 RepID=A0ABT7ILF4_9BURK|nr:DUF493 domain-containing protein [Mesosutterella sp. AGMB02718]MDL2058830.1 DUF493 domain-containing protein [Mesosutterella sp. AGMB02718]